MTTRKYGGVREFRVEALLTPTYEWQTTNPRCSHGRCTRNHKLNIIGQRKLRIKTNLAINDASSVFCVIWMDGMAAGLGWDATQTHFDWGRFQSRPQIVVFVAKSAINLTFHKIRVFLAMARTRRRRTKPNREFATKLNSLRLLWWESELVFKPTIITPKCSSSDYKWCRALDIHTYHLPGCCMRLYLTKRRDLAQVFLANSGNGRRRRQGGNQFNNQLWIRFCFSFSLAARREYCAVHS